MPMVTWHVRARNGSQADSQASALTIGQHCLRINIIAFKRMNDTLLVETPA